MQREPHKGEFSFALMGYDKKGWGDELTSGDMIISSNSESVGDGQSSGRGGGDGILNRPRPAFTSPTRPAKVLNPLATSSTSRS